MNFAGVRRLPVVFFIDNNQWAYSTPTHLAYAVEHLADRAAATASRASSWTAPTCSPSTARRRLQSKSAREAGPTLIESLTLRMEGHAVHDDASYVPKELFEWAKRDPIERFRTWLRERRAR